MCYDDQARPPAPPGAAGPAHGEEVVLTAADGNQFAAYFAAPEGNSTAQVVIYPDVRGLHQFYKELAMRFAETGITAIAIDYFGRTAGLTSRDDSFEYMPHVMQLQLDSFTQDVQAALAYLKQKGSQDAPVYVVGFCMGGAFTLLTGTNKELGFSGLIPFYAGLSRNFGGRGTPLENAGKVVYPVLGFFGGADQGIPESAVHELQQTLDEAKVPNNIIIYPGAPHSFFDRRASDYAEASSDAWRRLLDFIATGKVGAA
ncbi:MAG TPA: dienelactone hydrolase family protein [Chloroflexia bacterium]|nr:dienelactone hydrolase family protein [Chloroflexia bacterium]